MEKGELYMENIKATIENHNEKYFIKINFESEDVSIPLCEDNPNAIKSAFNKIISQIKKAEFQIQLEADGDNLFSQVSKEYITQLNREIAEIRSEMEQYKLT